MPKQRDLFDRPEEKQVIHPRKLEPEAILGGFVGYDKDGHFVHYCHCGLWAAYGYAVNTRTGNLGHWFCREHRP